MQYLLLLALAIAAAILIRKLTLRNDQIHNPDSDPFLAFAENERKHGKQMFAPWATSDESLLSLCKKNFPAISIPQPESLAKPDLTPVKLMQISPQDYQLVTDQTDYILAVGGPSAAMSAFQAAKNGAHVLYVNNNAVSVAGKKARPIWAGAANHIEPDVLSEATAYISGLHPFKFLWREIRQQMTSCRYDTDVLRDDYPWLTLNTTDWLRHPGQWLSGWRVAWGIYSLAHRKQSSVSGYEKICERAHISGKYLEQFNQEYPGLLREPFGSLIIAPDKLTWLILEKDRQNLSQKNNPLKQLAAEEVEIRFGFRPRNAYGIMEKTRDRILEPAFMDRVTQGIKLHGGEIHDNWRLTRLMIEADNEQRGIAEFLEINENDGNRFHYRKFIHAHLSLGSTLYDPNPYDLVSVTGVSMNALVVNAGLTGGPFVCGGVGNHIAIVPLGEPVQIHGQMVSLIRVAAGGCIGPRDRHAGRWYTYSGRTAVNALHCLRKTLPEMAQIKVLSVTGCNRLIGKDGRQVEICPYIYAGGQKKEVKSVTIQSGAGGGGLTQMGTRAHGFLTVETGE
jgi:hypothetical protein